VVIINTTLQYSSERAAGTGMVINAADGLVLTNNHVIENATKITATVAATGQKFPARVLGYDVTGDIALIQLQHPAGLHQVPVGDSSKVTMGAPVVALGNADGRSQIVAAAGHITGLNRTITASNQGGTVTSETLHGMLQTDAGIVSGDSGGPLVNSAGQVIGMDTAGNDVSFPDQQQTAAGFAIPINTAESVARQIAVGQASSTISIGYPPFIGIYVSQGTSSDPQQQAAAQQQQNNNGFGGFGGAAGNGQGNQSCYNSDANLPVPSTIAPVSSGTLVIGTICGGPAAAAGLTAGSVVTSVNGQAVGAPQTLHDALAKFKPGTTVSLTWVTPSGQNRTGTMTLTEGPPL
jgi:S1-C subfamily serine protease